MRVVSELIVAMVDDDDVPAGRGEICCLARNVLRHVIPYEDDGSFLGGKDLLSISVIIRVGLPIILVALPVRSDLQEVIGVSLRDESLVCVQVAVLRGDVPRSLKRQLSQEAGRAVELEGGAFLRRFLAACLVIDLDREAVADESLREVHEGVGYRLPFGRI